VVQGISNVQSSKMLKATYRTATVRERPLPL
jgi:hypothetical protein